jgi:hypothetical protein
MNWLACLSMCAVRDPLAERLTLTHQIIATTATLKL